MCVIKEINGIKKLLAVNKKGFLSMYALTILPVILVIISTLTYTIDKHVENQKINNSLHLCEIYTINYVKKALYTYQEEDVELLYDGYKIKLLYEDIICFITILKEDEIVLKSILEWDDIENVVVSYTYENPY